MTEIQLREENLLSLSSVDGRVWLDYCVGGQSWLSPGVPAVLFGLDANGQHFDAAGMQCLDLRDELRADGLRSLTARMAAAAQGVQVDYHILVYPGAALIEVWPVVRAAGPDVLRVTRLDSSVLQVATPSAANFQLHSFTGDWGGEFEPHGTGLTSSVVLQSRSGRSSKGDHPWFALQSGSGALLCGAPVWSGNWILRFEPLDAQALLFSGGLNDWEFYKDLRPGESMEGVHIVLGVGASLNQVSQQFATAGRAYWYPRNALSERLPVEWNPWWPYEDVEINEAVFLENVEAAARLGIEVCTLDAGWFGPSDAQAFWHAYRGDWRLVNQLRFPCGMRYLADQVHARGMAFGIWCEIEGLGSHAALSIEHPEFPAERAGQSLGYVCFGSPAAQEWAFQTLSSLIDEYRADWIKLDFNVDPGAGCDRGDHGHQTGDGLYAHYMGYYCTLARLRAAYPQVVLESCSSGGLRIDLGMLRQTHMTFLSDPDWPLHDLQIFWGASTLLGAERLLHWGFSDWRNSNPPAQQNFNPRDPRLTPKQFDYYTRISMLGLFGFSQKLAELPAWLAERIALHTRIYKDTVRRFVARANLYRLTPQPRRSGADQGWAAFQYSMPDGDEHLLFVFRLPGGEELEPIRMQGLQAQRMYTLAGMEAGAPRQMSGQELMTGGLTFANLLEEDSDLLRITLGESGSEQ